ncbi:hypothetical protein F4553_000192 [Allocatelliglobosispora scoriae]|uniref:Uncharacterized protein n=1 Tax=Allocatelliglobosispora scoriae TaxID=643052 RepID=A0A841BIC2_9ACTN|nr:hypothetical protein [Allocatelliglobosispora scoriae]MBB5866813.1 hypothetical protein [Allocatelliglobosispora scoriae]
MFTLKKTMAAVALVAGIAGMNAATASSASASDGAVARVCETGTFYYESHTDRYIGNPNTRVYGQAGGTLSISQGQSTTVSGSLQTTVSADAGVVFAKVGTSVGVTVGLSSQVTTTIGYTWTVPSNQSTGWIEMGSHGYQISWYKGYYISPCTWKQSGSGTLLGASKNAQFAHS